MPTERGERRAKGLLQTSLDAIPAHMAILDASGTVIAVNRAWHRFAEHNGCASAEHGIDLNYVDVCRAASRDIDAALAAEGVSALLGGERSEFGMQYACGNRWFLLFRIDLEPYQFVVDQEKAALAEAIEHQAAQGFP